MTYRSVYFSVLHFSANLFRTDAVVIAGIFQSFSSYQVVYHKVFHSYCRLIECFILQSVIQQINQQGYNHNRRDYYNNPCIIFINRWLHTQNCLVSDENRRVFTNNLWTLNYYLQVSEKNQ